MDKKAASGIMLTLLLTSMLILAFNIQPVKSSGTIYIRPDGAIDPLTAPIQRDGDIYTFTSNIYDEIVVEIDNIVVDGAGYTLQGTIALYTKGMDLTGRKNVTLRNMSIEAFYYGIYLDFSSENNIFGNVLTNNHYGIRLDYSPNNTITRNNITVNNEGGIFLFFSKHNCVSGNNITANRWEGIYLLYSSNNSISENNVTDNEDGIILVYSSSNNIFGNSITANRELGIAIHISSGNIIFQNDLVTNRYGIFLDDSSSNIFHHNNFLNNARQVYDRSWNPNIPYVPPSANIWDDGYPSGGNYWSDYKERYPDAEELDDSRLWNTPYAIDENNQDNYPLMEPWGSKPQTPEEGLEELMQTIDTWDLPKRTENSLTSKLEVALHRLDVGNGNGAIHKLIGFINQVEAQRDKKLSAEQAHYLISEAQRIIDLIEE